MIDVLTLQDAKQIATAAEKVATALGTVSDMYVASTFRLPPKLGGVLLGLYNKQDNKKYLEVAVMGKINKGAELGTGAVFGGDLLSYFISILKCWSCAGSL